MSLNNPASRLLVILREGLKYNHVGNCRETWSKLLKIDPKNHTLLLAQLGKLMVLPSEIESILARDFPKQLQSLSHCLAQINLAFGNQQLGGTWNTFKSKIDEHCINYLTLTAEMIQDASGEPLLESDYIANCRSQLNEIKAEIMASEIDDDLSAFLIRSINKIISALDEYHISGAAPIQEQIKVIFATVALDADYRETANTSPVISTLLKALSSLSNATTLVTNLPQLTETFQKLLG